MAESERVERGLVPPLHQERSLNRPCGKDLGWDQVEKAGPGFGAESANSEVQCDRLQL